MRAILAAVRRLAPEPEPEATLVEAGALVRRAHVYNNYCSARTRTEAATVPPCHRAEKRALRSCDTAAIRKISTSQDLCRAQPRGVVGRELCLRRNPRRDTYAR